MNPYKIEGPALISFSGGRTSGYMLYHILKAHDFNLPDDIYITFANTGKEAEQTLEFVRDCGINWGVKIHWLEHYFADERPKHRTKEVTFETASRNGEPFERLIDDRQMLPNAVSRFCSSELKIKVLARFMRSQGYKEWGNVLGLRYDEPKRAVSARAADYQKWHNLVPLYDAQVTIKDVIEFWDNSSFDLKLRSFDGKTLGGNCDLCFLKSTQTLTKLIKEEPDRAEWWIKQEQKFKHKEALASKTNQFRKNMDYIYLVDLSKQGDLFGLDDSSQTCFCHD